MARAQLANNTNTSTIKILHVDDDTTFLEISDLMLKEMDSNFEIESVNNVEAAYQKLDRATYDLVLSDYEMPHKSGLDFLKDLKLKSTRLPFILFTGRGREEVAIDALNLGADGYFNKQGSPETVYGELAHGIKSAVAAHRDRQALRDSEFKFENIANFATEWIYWLTPNCQFSYVSPSCLKITGYSADEFLSDPGLLNRIIDPRDQKITDKHFDDFTALENHTAEFRIKTKDNQIRWILHACTPIVDDDGRWLGRRATNQDVTERKVACEEVARSEEKYRDLVDNLSEGIWIIDPSAHTTFVNPTMAKMLGYTPEEMLGKHLFRFVDEKQMATIKGIMASRNRGNNEVLNYDFEFRHKDGTPRVLSVNTRAILDKKGKLKELLGTFIDVTERKKAQDALAASETQYHQLFDSMTEMFQVFELVFDENGNAVDYRLVDVNPALERLVGKKREELVGKQVNRDLWSVEGYWLEKFAQVLKTGNSAHYENYGDAFNRYFDLYIYRLNSKQLASIATDITERKKAEKAIKESEERFRSVLNSSPAIIYRLNLQTGRYEYTSPAIRNLGYEMEEITAMSTEALFARVHPDDLELFRSEIAKISHSGKGVVEYRFRGKDDVYRWFSVQLVTINDQNGKPLYRDGFGIDITERKKAELALQDSEARLQFATEAANIGLWDLDLVDHTAYRSLAHSRIFGYDNVTDDWTFEKFLDHMLPQYREKFLELTKKATAERHGWSYECEIRRVDGQVRRIWLTGRLYKSSSGYDRVAGIVVDVTEQRSMKRN